ncbi:MAG TPA: ABC transporter permease [Euzebyales bacterium]
MTTPAGRDPVPDSGASTDAEEERREAAAREEERGHAVDVGASVGQRFLAALSATTVLTTVLAIVAALVVGAIILALASEETREALGYFFAQPADTFAALKESVWDVYAALLRGAFGGANQLSETITAATPLILTGLAVAVPLRAGLFNIGGEGQFLAGGAFAGYVGFAITGLPLVVHLPLAVLAGIVGGALWGWIPGVLKARTGAHEVITTIMLNNVAILGVEYMLSLDAVQPIGRDDPLSRGMLDSATLPRLAGAGRRVNAGIIVAFLLALVLWWLLERSTRGFELTAVGLNPEAARSAGMNVATTVTIAMLVGGIAAGLGGTSQVLGVDGRISAGLGGGRGFDGITVALLGRGGVGGTVFAGLLFGALEAGGRLMQAQTGTSLDLVSVIQALIVLFIAAPALVQAMFRIQPDTTAGTDIASGWGQ